MNSNSDYTICNLDSHTTYSANFVPDSIGSTGYSYSNVNNGLSDTGQLGYGASASLQQAGAVELSHGGGHHPGHHIYSHHSNSTSVLTPTPPPPGSYPMHPGTCVTGQPGYDYYGPPGVNTNGGVDITNTTSTYSYPDHTAGHVHQAPGLPPSSAAYGVHNSNSGSQASEQGPVTTYKWMTVKRGNHKQGKPCIFPTKIHYVPVYIVLVSRYCVNHLQYIGKVERWCRASGVLPVQ